MIFQSSGCQDPGPHFRSGGCFSSAKVNYKEGRTVDFLLSKRRDVATAKRFFSRAAKQHGAPRVITLDGYAASHRAVDKLKTSPSSLHMIEADEELEHNLKEIRATCSLF
jgi:transposase-like protein